MSGDGGIGGGRRPQDVRSGDGFAALAEQAQGRWQDFERVGGEQLDTHKGGFALKKALRKRGQIVMAGDAAAPGREEALMGGFDDQGLLGHERSGLLDSAGGGVPAVGEELLLALVVGTGGIESGVRGPKFVHGGDE